MKKSSYSILVSGAIGAAIGFGVIFFFRGSTRIEILLVISFALMLGVLAMFCDLVIDFLNFLDGRRGNEKEVFRPVNRSASRIVRYVSTLGGVNFAKGCCLSFAAFTWCLAMVYFAPGTWLERYDLRQAQQYCERLAALVETEKARAGSYPTTVIGLQQQLGTVPYYLRSHGIQYQHSHEGFSIGFSGKVFDLWLYNPNTRTWVKD